MPLINKKTIRNALTSEPLRRLVGPLYQALTSAELLTSRAVDARCFAPPLAPAELDSITAVVKAFERPRSLRRLLDSLQRWFPGIHIIVADDSRIATDLPGVE